MGQAQWFLAHESLQRFDTQCKLPAGKRALGSYIPRTQPFKVLREKVLGAVDDAKVFCAPTFYGWLSDAASAFCDKVERLTRASGCGIEGKTG